MDTLAPRGNIGKDTIGTDAYFFVNGRPVPQGSLKFIRGHAIHVRAQDLALWRADIASSARFANVSKMEGAVEVSMTFVFNKPKSVKRKHPHVRPDLDKLVRAVLDGLTDVAYLDDQQVTRLSASKVYGDTQGVWIKIKDVEKLLTMFEKEKELTDNSD
jgi:Holliday junction resolvase RusA-like endonuclease